MKKFVIPIVLLLVAAFMVGFFALYHKEEIIPEEKFTVVRVDELRILDMPKSQIDFSPIVSAILYTHLKDHDLHLTLPVSVLSTRLLTTSDSLFCGFDYNGHKIYNQLNFDNLKEHAGEGSLSVGEYTKQKNAYLYCLQLDYDLATLLSNMDEMEVLDYVASMTSILNVKDVFLGKNGDPLNSFLQGTWKNVPLNTNSKQ